MFIIFYRLLLMPSQGGDEEVYLLPGEGEAGDSGFPLVQGKGRDREDKKAKQNWESND